MPANAHMLYIVHVTSVVMDSGHAFSNYILLWQYRTDLIAF